MVDLTKMSSWLTLSSKIPKKEGALAVLILLFSGLVVAFLWRSEHSVVLKYVTMLLGVMLAGAIPELASKRRLAFRVFLVCVPAVGAVLVQIGSDRENENSAKQLSRQLETRNLRDVQIEIRAMEGRSRESLVPAPYDTISAIKNADRGFLRKAERLAFRVVHAESELLLGQPDLMRMMVVLPTEPAARAAEYRKLILQQKFVAKTNEGMAKVIRLLETEIAYRTIADVFLKEVSPQYLSLENRAANSGMGDAELCQRLSEISVSLRALVQVYPVAGLHNHLGSIAMACERRVEALGHLYTGLAVDHDHVPAYESLGYALWIVNDDARGALRMATEALTLSETELKALQQELADALSAYVQAGKDHPEIREISIERADELQSRLNAFEPGWVQFMQGMKDKITLQFAYFSALQLINESQARERMKTLYESAPADAEYQDGWGFVLMRFARDHSDLDEAEKQFRLAIKNSAGERITSRLASIHVQEVLKLREQLEARQ
jgi:hypothetical protein